MDSEDFVNDSGKSKSERTTDIDRRESKTLRDLGAQLEPERSEFEDPGFRSVWVMLVGLGIFLAAVALVITTS
jgi:hypothetical protein